METEIEYNCPNCNRPIRDNFCSNCGQRKYKRIDKKYIWEEVQYTVLHTNKGFFYSVKNVLKNPGKTAKEFIDGNRVNHYKPLLLVFLLSGIATFISYKIIETNAIMKEYYLQKGLYTDLMNDALAFAATYNSFIMLLFIPVLAAFTKIAFRKWGHNYYEHVVMNAYTLSFNIIISILLFYPVMYFSQNNVEVFIFMSHLSIAIVPFVLVWFYKGFYKDKTLISIILRVLLVLLMIFIAYIVLVLAIAIYIHIYDQEALQYTQPK